MKWNDGTDDIADAVYLCSMAFSRHNNVIIFQLKFETNMIWKIRFLIDNNNQFSSPSEGKESHAKLKK